MSTHTIKCRETGEALANKLDGGTCVCKPGECEMREMREKKGDYAHYNTDPNRSEDFDAMGFAIGLATGFPVSPRGITMGSILGSILHPTERHAAYDVTSATPTLDDAPKRAYDFNLAPRDADDSQPRSPAVPVRAPDWDDNRTHEGEPDKPQIGITVREPDPPTRDPDPAPFSPPDDYKPATPADDYKPSYSAPANDDKPYSAPDAPSYSAPDTYTAPDSGGGSVGGSND